MIDDSEPTTDDLARLIVGKLRELPSRFLRMTSENKEKLRQWIEETRDDLVRVTWFDIPDLTGSEGWVDRSIRDVNFGTLPNVMAIHVRQLIGIFSYPQYRDDQQYPQSVFGPLCIKTYEQLLKVWEQLRVEIPNGGNVTP